MKKNYQKPKLELLETGGDSVLCASGETGNTVDSVIVDEGEEWGIKN